MKLNSSNFHIASNSAQHGGSNSSSNIDIYNSIMQDDLRRYQAEKEMVRMQKKKNQQSWANYLKLQMDIKKEK